MERTDSDSTAAMHHPTPTFLLARCNRYGSLDPTFGAGGKVRTSFGALNDGANAAVLQPDGKIVAVGFNAWQTSTGVDFALARYIGSSP